MNQRPVLNQVLGGVGAIAGSPLFREVVRNWWLSAPLGYAAYVLIRQRQKRGELTVPNVISDLAPMVTVVGTLVMLNHILSQRAPAPAPRAPIAARDASFTPNPAQNDVIPAIPVEDA